MSRLKIISWNVNGIRAIQKKGLDQYLAQEQPDIFCVQETKAHPEQLDKTLTNPEGYHVTYHSCSVKKGYSGVATFSKILPDAVETCFGVEKFDNEGRVVQTDYGSFVLLNVYFPNGGMEHRLPYKLEFYDAFFAYCDGLRAQGRKLLICGDYNTAHQEIDLARPKQNITTSGFMPIEREKLDQIVDKGYVDTFREFTTEPEHYTWWSNQQRSRERNVGWQWLAGRGPGRRRNRLHSTNRPGVVNRIYTDLATLAVTPLGLRVVDRVAGLSHAELEELSQLQLMEA